MLSTSQKCSPCQVSRYRTTTSHPISGRRWGETGPCAAAGCQHWTEHSDRSDSRSHCPPLASRKHSPLARRQLTRITLHTPATHLLLCSFSRAAGPGKVQPQASEEAVCKQSGEIAAQQPPLLEAAAADRISLPRYRTACFLCHSPVACPLTRSESNRSPTKAHLLQVRITTGKKMTRSAI